MTFNITGSAMSALGFKDGDKIDVLVGNGDHHGIVRIRKDEAGEAVCEELATKFTYQRIKLGHQPQFVNRNTGMLWCKWEALDGEDEGWIEIILPTWADETNPLRKKPDLPAPQAPLRVAPSEKALAEAKAYRSPAVTAARTQKQEPPKRNVTAGLMGDPPPGRREMLEKIGQIKP